MKYLIEVMALVHDYAGVKVSVPEDLTRLIAIDVDGIVVWTKNSSIHRVRYGLQFKDFKTNHEASIEFAQCLEHKLRCRGDM
jgi:hypothetical protein